MKWTGQTVHTCCKTVIRIRERCANKVCGMCGYIAALMISVQYHVQTHQALYLLTLEAHHMGHIAGPIQRGIHLNLFSIVKYPSVNIGSNNWQAADKIHHSLIHRIPIILLDRKSVV